MSDEPERQATEELLAGFDRPGRSPRAPPVRLDFNPHTPATGADTVLVTRRRGRALWPWLIAAFLCSVVLGIIALTFGLRRSPPAPAPAPESPASIAVEPVPAPVPTPSSVPAPASAAPKIVKPAAPAKKPEEHRGDFIPNL